MADSVNLQKIYSSLNEAIIKTFDESGVRRSFTVPYIEGQQMDEHIQSVNAAATQTGGLTGNLVTTAHHSGGKGYGSGEGHTVGHPAEKLRTTLLPKDNANAKAAITQTQKLIDGVAKLIGEKNPAVLTAQSQLNLVKPTSGAGMNLLDFGVMMLQITHKPLQMVAQAHSGAKPGGHSPQLRAPHDPRAQAGQETDQGGAPGGEQAPTDQAAAPEAPAASAAPIAAPQAQG